MSAVNLVWITPNAEQVISDCARVSNPSNQGKDGTKLIHYLISNNHWSPLEMASMCVEINTTRDIARQILRHRSFSFQEFSQRYADVKVLEQYAFREARLQDPKNRQNSVDLDLTDNNQFALDEWWSRNQRFVWNSALATYNEALAQGIAKEVARAVLPEGLTPSRMYMSGTLRSWFHFCDVRCGNGTQKETMEIAWAVLSLLEQQCPNIAKTIKEVHA